MTPEAVDLFRHGRTFILPGMASSSSSSSRPPPADADTSVWLSEAARCCMGEAAPAAAGGQWRLPQQDRRRGCALLSDEVVVAWFEWV